MTDRAVTVEDVRQAQEHFKVGDINYKDKNFKEAAVAFKASVKVHPYDEGHLAELEKKLKAGQYKLHQESIAYMGCAAVQLNRMIQELTEEQRDQVPLDEGLMKVFQEWQ